MPDFPSGLTGSLLSRSAHCQTLGNYSRVNSAINFNLKHPSVTVSHLSKHLSTLSLTLWHLSSPASTQPKRVSVQSPRNFLVLLFFASDIYGELKTTVLQEIVNMPLLPCAQHDLQVYGKLMGRKDFRYRNLWAKWAWPARSGRIAFQVLDVHKAAQVLSHKERMKIARKIVRLMMVISVLCTSPFYCLSFTLLIYLGINKDSKLRFYRFDWRRAVLRAPIAYLMSMFRSYIVFGGKQLLYIGRWNPEN